MNDLAKILTSATVVFGLGCTHVEKNRTDAYVPAQLQCETETDSTCNGEATVGIQIPIREKNTTSNPHANDHALVGRCEFFEDGSDEPRPCNQIKLVARSTRENEVRAAVIDGYNFRIQDAQSGSYQLESASPGYEVITDSNVVKPGQTVKIRVKAKPKP